MTPLPYEWTGDSWKVMPGFQRQADQIFAIGERMRLAPVEDRSDASHKHHFAWLREAWASLPEALADQFPSPEHLRKRALIMGGFYTETIVDAGSNAAALRVAAYMAAKDQFSHVVVRGPLAVERIARSQSRRTMDKAEFQASKTAILEIVGEMIGVAPETLAEQKAAA